MQSTPIESRIAIECGFTASCGGRRCANTKNLEDEDVWVTKHQFWIPMMCLNQATAVLAKPEYYEFLLTYVDLPVCVLFERSTILLPEDTLPWMMCVVMDLRTQSNQQNNASGQKYQMVAQLLDVGYRVLGNLEKTTISRMWLH